MFWDRYYNRIVAMLEGGTTGDPDAHDPRNDWSGMGAFITFFRGTAGDERKKVIEAMGRVLKNANKHPIAAARCVLLVNALDLRELDLEVRNLASWGKERVSYLDREVMSYIASRDTTHMDQQRERRLDAIQAQEELHDATARPSSDRTGPRQVGPQDSQPFGVLVVGRD